MVVSGLVALGVRCPQGTVTTFTDPELDSD
jgi:hypothetical protein